MRHYALTGTVAAGKSTVAALFERWGATRIDADAIVRTLQQPGEPVHDQIVARFGSEVVTRDGQLDRSALRRIMLADVDARRDLEAIIHPAVEERRHALLDAARTRNDAVVVSEIPLLFEAGDPSAFDGVIVVDAPVDVRRDRLVADRGLSRTEADGLMAAQWAPSRKRAQATWIIENEQSRVALHHRARIVWDAMNA
ncbi:MAG: dephospho-CoA kinase [Gemmatimonadales bacterium]|nr:dephospho-CoA kinase [Gemmatimonadales bacterium]